jgi:hypothetical protein
MASAMKRSMSSREMMIRTGKEITKSVIVAKTFEQAMRRSGAAAAMSTAGMLGWGGSMAFARRLHPDYLDPVSSNQINQDPEYCMNCHMLMFTDEVCTMEAIRTSFEFYVKNFPRFSQRVVVRRFLWPYWDDVEEIHWENHILNDDSIMDPELMEGYISNSLTTGMDPDQPLWKITRFPNYTSDDGTKGCAMLLKFHHCMGDGFSFANAFMTGVEKPDLPAAPPPRDVARHKPGQVGAKVGSMFGAAAKLLGAKDDPPSVLKAKNLLNAKDARHAVWITAQATVEDIKRVSKVHGFTINDVVLGALSGALRQFQVLKGSDTVVDPLSVIWVALRPISEALTVKDPTEVEDPRNKTLGCLLLRLPVSQDMSAVDRTKAVASLVNEMKGSPEPLLAQSINGAFGLLPKQFSSGIWDLLSNKVSISVSNVPGPKFEMKWAGATMKSVQCWVPPVGTISTFALVTSFRNRLSLALGMDAAVFSKEDAKFITQAFSKELDLIVASTPPASRL